MKDRIKKIFPWSILAIAMAMVMVKALDRPVYDGPYHMDGVASLPVSSEGRVKPLDTVARANLMILSGRQTISPQRLPRTILAVVEDQRGTWIVQATGSASSMGRYRSDIFAFLHSFKQTTSVTANASQTQPATASFDWKVPSRWIGEADAPESVMAAYRLDPEDESRSMATISRLVGNDQTVENVLNEARRQVGLSANDSADANMPEEEFTQGGLHVSVYEFARSTSMPATRWLLDTLARPSVASHYQVFRIDHPDVLALMNRKRGEQKYFSIAELEQHRVTLQQQTRQASQVEAKQRNSFQNHVIELYTHLNRYFELVQMRRPYYIPPATKQQTWQQFFEIASKQSKSDTPNAAVASLATLVHSYNRNDPAQFNTTLAQYRGYLNGLVPSEMGKSRYEVFFNYFSPFYLATILAVVVFLLGCMSWVVWPDMLRRSAMLLLTLVLVLFTFGLVSRMILQGRPPVTNLYSSAVFIGWGCVLIGLVLEWLYRNSIGVVAGAIIGFVTLVIAHNLANGDTMQMMQAVLDTNVWLATHVVAVTVGYMATFFAGLLGVIFIFRGVLTTSLSADEKRTMGRMIYGILCFALLFSFVGTVLGGIWADQSWGRFWGWDPKENGAALIVLMNALILHARWGGMVRERGMAVLAVCGNIVTAWSWFGTNMLGVGLHSYGFMESGVIWLAGFVFSQAIIISLGLLPLQSWRSGELMMQRRRSKSPVQWPARPDRRRK